MAKKYVVRLTREEREMLLRMVSAGKGAARRLAEKIEIVYTLKHGSWLNVAEIEFGVLDRQYISQHIGSAPVLKRHVSAWNKDRNRSRGRVPLAVHDRQGASEAAQALPADTRLTEH